MAPWALNRFSQAVLQGAVFAYPTDTVWGFGCHPLIASSVARILQIKNRSADKGLILLSSRLEYCLDYVDAEPEALDGIRLPAHRPTTWIVDADPSCPAWLRGRHSTIAIRITDHPFVNALCDRIRAPIVSTSANRSGVSCARNPIQLRRQFAGQLDFIVNGYETGNGRPSEIKFLADGNTVRAAG